MFWIDLLPRAPGPLTGWQRCNGLGISGSPKNVLCNTPGGDEPASWGIGGPVDPRYVLVVVIYSTVLIQFPRNDKTSPSNQASMLTSSCLLKL